MMHEDLSRKIIGIAMNVQNTYGSSHKERIYQKTFEEQLKINDLLFVAQPKIMVYSLDSGEEFGWYQPDLLIEDKIVLELKAVPFSSSKFERQTLEYLRTSKYEIAYLINFGIWPLYFKRFIHTLDRKRILNP